jgi:hypothetical protein
METEWHKNWHRDDAENFVAQEWLWLGNNSLLPNESCLILQAKQSNGSCRVGIQLSLILPFAEQL